MAQQSVASLPADQQDLVMDRTRRASEEYPSVEIEGHLVHVCDMDGDWNVWINCDDADFTGLCIGWGATKDLALARAVKSLEAITEHLQSGNA